MNTESIQQLIEAEAKKLAARQTPEAEKVKHLAVGSEERRRRFDEIADRIVREDHELLVELAKR